MKERNITRIKNQLVTYAYEDRLDELKISLNNLKSILKYTTNTHIKFNNCCIFPLKISIENQSINCCRYLVDNGISINDNDICEILRKCNYKIIYEVYNLIIELGFSINELSIKNLIIRRLIDPSKNNSQDRVFLLFKYVENDFLSIDSIVKIMNANTKYLILSRELRLKSIGL